MMKIIIFMVSFIVLTEFHNAEGKCKDLDNDFTDSEGKSCKWYEWEYDYCGDYDDDDFDADKMCCDCGGGYDIPVPGSGADCNGLNGGENNPDCQPGEKCVSVFGYAGRCRLV